MLLSDHLPQSRQQSLHISHITEITQGHVYAALNQRHQGRCRSRRSLLQLGFIDMEARRHAAVASLRRCQCRSQSQGILDCTW